MKLNKLTLRDQGLFNKHLAFARHELASFSFANTYIWRAIFDIQWTLVENSLCVFFRDKVGCFMYLPPLGEKPCLLAIKQSFVIMDGINKNKDISRIENIGQEDLEYYRASGYLCRQKYPDYLCSRSELANLRGNKFKSQRASYNYFIKHYNFEVSTLKLKDEAGCLSLFDNWIEERKAHCDEDFYCGMLEDNRKVIKEALSNYEQLDLKGITVKVDENIKGFTFGYKLNNDTFCILYEVTDLSIKGLAQFIFCKFSGGLKNYNYINIMDDSGLDNLRKVKLSYKPERLITAYIATRDV
ncbi:MAG: phosphatidylglycerol lysyltransferase domain-containing protein [Candidatus Omnitrophica bacterium]|nr:phosphatidylglycerol lysyltransferase domain-containing protein [Candidatus Omnitrophota bacterium]MDD5691194.1 phosphatidylglycerol lysyltransferase domain-containing protein [Candidatus Omnitrophota bacterium]